MNEILDASFYHGRHLWDVKNLLVLGVVVVGGFLRGFVGFGGALVIIPVVSLIHNPRDAVALHAVIEIPALFRLVPVAWKHADRKFIGNVILGLIVLMPVGTWFLAYIDPDIMRIAVALVVLTMVALVAADWRFPGPIGAGIAFGVGSVSGFIQGAVGTGGPPIVAVLLSRPDTSDIVRGNILGAMASLHLIAPVVLWSYGIFTSHNIAMGIVATPVFLMAIGLGARHYGVSGNSYYRAAALTVLALVAAVSLFTVLAV